MRFTTKVIQCVPSVPFNNTVNIVTETDLALAFRQHHASSSQHQVQNHSVHRLCSDVLLDALKAAIDIVGQTLW